MLCVFCSVTLHGQHGVPNMLNYISGLDTSLSASALWTILDLPICPPSSFDKVVSLPWVFLWIWFLHRCFYNMGNTSRLWTSDSQWLETFRIYVLCVNIFSMKWVYLNSLALISFSSPKLEKKLEVAAWLVLFTNFAMLSRFKPDPSNRHDEALIQIRLAVYIVFTKVQEPFLVTVKLTTLNHKASTKWKQELLKHEQVRLVGEL